MKIVALDVHTLYNLLRIIATICQILYITGNVLRVLDFHVLTHLIFTI